MRIVLPLLHANRAPRRRLHGSKRMRHLLLKSLVVGALLVFGMLSNAVRAEDFGAGFLDLQLTDPVEGGPMPAVVFYPTKAEVAPTQVGPFTIAATRGAAPAPGAYPL